MENNDTVFEEVTLEATHDTMELVGELLADQLLVIGFNTEPDSARTSRVSDSRNGGQLVKVLGQKLSGRVAWQVMSVREDDKVSHPLVEGWEFKDGLPALAPYQKRVTAVLNEWAGMEVAHNAAKLTTKVAKSFVKTKDQKPAERPTTRKGQQREAATPVVANAALKTLVKKINEQLAAQPSAEGFVRQVMFDLDGEPVITEVRMKAQEATV